MATLVVGTGMTGSQVVCPQRQLKWQAVKGYLYFMIYRKGRRSYKNDEYIRKTTPFSSLVLSLFWWFRTVITLLPHSCWGGGMWTCERGHQKPALLAFDARNPPCPLDSPHKGSIMRKVCWYDDIIILPICPFLCIYTHFAYLTRWSLGNVVEILKTYFSTITPHPFTPTPMKLGLVVFLDYWIHHVSSHWCHHKKYPSVCPPVDGMVCGA